MFTIVFYALAAGFLIFSFFANKEKTKLALVKALRAFWGILPEFIVVIFVAGLILAFLDPAAVSRFAGEESGIAGVLAAAITGSVTLMPGFVAFPLAALIYRQGAGLVQIAAFVSALMMVGVATFPVERAVFGTKIALIRNSMAFVFALIVAGVIAMVLGGLR